MKVHKDKVRVLGHKRQIKPSNKAYCLDHLAQVLQYFTMGQ
jgi:hypothetical protein